MQLPLEVAFQGVIHGAIYALIAVSRGPSAGPMFKQTSAQVGATMRYHYVPQAFLVVATCAALSVLAPRRRSLVASVWGLLLFGGHVLRGFTAAMMLGIIVGTYSSVYVSSSLLITLGLQPRPLDAKEVGIGGSEPVGPKP